MIIEQRCKLKRDELVRSYAFYGGDNNHSMVILCQEARENNGVCPKGRRYICEFGGFVDQKRQCIECGSEDLKEGPFLYILAKYLCRECARVELG